MSVRLLTAFEKKYSFGIELRHFKISHPKSIINVNESEQKITLQICPCEYCAPRILSFDDAFDFFHLVNNLPY